MSRFGLLCRRDLFSHYYVAGDTETSTRRRPTPRAGKTDASTPAISSELIDEIVESHNVSSNCLRNMMTFEAQ